ncbi:MAG TPA: hypothetical protein VE956_08580 [Nodularia sp. (in: cyanobacteria)]|nr:hypothetical protein [Nodularia sp. (in: cyanobacteria)]
MTSKSWSWKAIKDWFEFFLILAALCACGYIAWNQLIYLYLMLVLGGVAAGLAPLVSRIYNIPHEWIGLAPSLTQFFEISRDKVEQLNKLEEAELQNATEEFVKAKEIIGQYVQKNPDLVNRHPQLKEIIRQANIGQETSQDIYKDRVEKRQIHEEIERKEREKREAQKKKEVEQYWQRVERERERKKLTLGVPPADKFTCPSGYPIRATENLKNENYRGIYYLRDERKGVQVDWCFKHPEDAETEKFRRSKKTPPKYQR